MVKKFANEGNKMNAALAGCIGFVSGFITCVIFFASLATAPACVDQAEEVEVVPEEVEVVHEEVVPDNG